MFAMSFDRELAEYSTAKYTEELEIPKDELHLYLEETVADIINIILGNSLSRFQLDGEKIMDFPDFTRQILIQKNNLPQTSLVKYRLYVSDAF